MAEIARRLDGRFGHCYGHKENEFQDGPIVMIVGNVPKMCSLDRNRNSKHPVSGTDDTANHGRRIPT